MTFADSLFRPGVHPGLAYLVPPGPVLSPVQGARIRQFAACDDDSADRYVRSKLDPRWRWPGNAPVFRLAASPVLLSDAEYHPSGVKIGGRWLLSGAAGNRVWARLTRRHGQAEARDAAQALDAMQHAGAIPETNISARAAERIPFAVDLRNGYNFYHFMTEGMPQIAVIAGLDSQAPIHVHMPRLGDLKPFVGNFIEMMFPGLMERITFFDVRTSYDQVRAVYHHRHYLYQVDDPDLGPVLRHLPSDDPWRQLSAGLFSRGFVSKSTADDGQYALAAAARDHLSRGGVREFPSRVLVMRDPASGARDRQDERSESFQQKMADLGFKTLFMERLSPREQIALWSQAQVVVSPHGAAFAHMLFAAPSTEVIEIGTPQTQRYRWGDFLQNAHVSRCRYTTIFSDVSRAGSDHRSEDVVVPPMSDGLKGVRYSDRLIEAIAGRLEAQSESAASGLRKT